MNYPLLLKILIAVLLDGAAALAGGLIPSRHLHRHITPLLAFAAGTLLGAAFFDMIPEAMESHVPVRGLMTVLLCGFAGFYAIEQFLGSHATGHGGHRPGTTGPFLLIGDAIHNITDGMAIAAAFLTSTQVGIATTVAVVFHELPQEIGDYAILIAQGYPKGRALFLLVLVQLSAVLGAAGVFLASQLLMTSIPYLLALAAGGFIYIAAADLLPELQHHRRSEQGPAWLIVAFSVGIGLMAILRA